MKAYLSFPSELSVTTAQASNQVVIAATDYPSRFGKDMQNVTRNPAISAVCDGVTDKIPETDPLDIENIDLQAANELSLNTEPEAWLSETSELKIRGSCDDMLAAIVRLSADNLALQRDLLTCYCQAYDPKHIGYLWQAREERAAIMEYDGELCRQEAEYQAAERLHLLAFMDGCNCGRS